MIQSGKRKMVIKRIVSLIAVILACFALSACKKKGFQDHLNETLSTLEKAKGIHYTFSFQETPEDEQEPSHTLKFEYFVNYEKPQAIREFLFKVDGKIKGKDYNFKVIYKDKELKTIVSDREVFKNTLEGLNIDTSDLKYQAFSIANFLKPFKDIFTEEFVKLLNIENQKFNFETTNFSKLETHKFKSDFQENVLELGGNFVVKNKLLENVSLNYEVLKKVTATTNKQFKRELVFSFVKIDVNSQIEINF